MFKSWHDLPRNARILIIYYTLSSIPIIADIFLPIYLFILGWKLVEIGILISYSFIVSIIGSVVFGRILDLGFQPKWAMFFIDASATILYLIYAFAPRVDYIYLGLSLYSFLDPLSVAYQTVEKAFYPEEQYETSFSYHMSLPNASQLFAMLLTGFALTYVYGGVNGFRLLFISCALIMSISCIYILLMIPRTKKARVNFPFSLSITKSLIPVIFAELIIYLGYSISPEFIYLNFVYNVAQLNLFLISITLALANIAGILGSYLTTGRNANLRYLSIAIIFSAISYSLPYFSKFINNNFQVFLLSCLFTFSSYTAHTVWFIYHRTILYKRVPQEYKGTVFGFIFSGRYFIYIISPVLSALIASSIDPLANFLISSIIILASMPFYFYVFKSDNN